MQFSFFVYLMFAIFGHIPLRHSTTVLLHYINTLLPSWHIWCTINRCCDLLHIWRKKTMNFHDVTDLKGYFNCFLLVVNKGVVLTAPGIICHRHTAPKYEGKTKEQHTNQLCALIFSLSLFAFPGCRIQLFLSGQLQRALVEVKGREGGTNSGLASE